MGLDRPRASDLEALGSNRCRAGSASSAIAHARRRGSAGARRAGRTHGGWRAARPGHDRARSRRRRAGRGSTRVRLPRRAGSVEADRSAEDPRDLVDVGRPPDEDLGRGDRPKASSQSSCAGETFPASDFSSATTRREARNRISSGKPAGLWIDDQVWYLRQPKSPARSRTQPVSSFSVTRATRDRESRRDRQGGHPRASAGGRRPGARPARPARAAAAGSSSSARHW
jgi:hypothetical protein